MSESKNIKVMTRKASDNFYLHKDFHGALCYAIKYLEENFGAAAVREYFEQVGSSYFSVLSDKLKKEGLSALEDHFTKIMTLEAGEFDFSYEGSTLVLRVSKCPAIMHLKSINALFTDSFCESTVVVNETICKNAGYQCSCEYQKGEGKCIQKFWKN